MSRRYRQIPRGDIVGGKHVVHQVHLKEEYNMRDRAWCGAQTKNPSALVLAVHPDDVTCLRCQAPARKLKESRRHA